MESSIAEFLMRQLAPEQLPIGRLALWTLNPAIAVQIRARPSLHTRHVCAVSAPLLFLAFRRWWKPAEMARARCALLCACVCVPFTHPKFPSGRRVDHAVIKT